jgi:transposase
MREQQWVGIDVCQKYLDVYVRPKGKLFQVSNNEIGITQLVQTLMAIQPELIVLEATGGMEINVTIKLAQAGLAVAVINPRQARDFALINGNISQNRCNRCEVVSALCRCHTTRS